MLYYIDHTANFKRNTGIQRCVRAIAAGLIELGVPLNPVVWDRLKLDFVPASQTAKSHLARWNGPNADSWDFKLIDQRLLKLDRWLLIVELVSGPHNPSPRQIRQAADRRGLQVAWVFHDAIPVLKSHLQGAQSSNQSHWHARYMRGLTMFERVLANSHASRRDLENFLIRDGHTFDSKCNPLRVVRLADGIAKKRVNALQCLNSASENQNEFVLSVGSLEPRKNHISLLKAFVWLHAQKLWPDRVKLILVGWAQDESVVKTVVRTKRLGLPLIWESNADDQRLENLYRACIFTVYPSLAEGFGLPVAESLAYGKVCICSDVGALGELALEGGCLTVSMDSWKSLSEGIAQLLNVVDYRIALENMARRRPCRTWTMYCQDLLRQLDVKV